MTLASPATIGRHFRIKTTNGDSIMTTLQGQVAWVTGAASGIGLAGAQALAQAGATVVMSGRRREALQAQADAINAAGGRAEVEVLDVSDADAVGTVAQAILGRHG